MRDRLKKSLTVCFLLGCACVYFGRPLFVSGRGQAGAKNPLSRWRPARDYSGVGYTGAAACAQCHVKESSAQAATPMAHAAEAPAACEVLKSRAPLSFTNGAYTYRITREGEHAIYTITDGVSTISEPVLYCFGQGVAGQTYIFRHDGAYYESRVSYFQTSKGLDITILHPRAAPVSVEDGLGRPLSDEATRGCFSCHATAVVFGARQGLEHASPGVSCEACHGPGERHVAAMKSKDLRDLKIFNPARLGAIEQSQEFCGACHQSFDTVMSLDAQGGAANIRFQPYRIYNSRGHLVDDPRMSCVACHDPHDQLQHDTAFYDSKCLACHLSTAKEIRTQARNAPACPVSTKQCATCHMPKVELPEMHYRFTDHWIRVVKPGDAVPR
ncbi:MAG: multiheme c-type cytochrome [Pyrinomonadaceae bacterium]